MGRTQGPTQHTVIDATVRSSKHDLDDYPPRSRSVSPFTQRRRDPEVPPIRSITPSSVMSRHLQASDRGELSTSASTATAVRTRRDSQDGLSAQKVNSSSQGLRHSRSFDLLSRFKAPSPVPAGERPSAGTTSSANTNQRDILGRGASPMQTWVGRRAASSAAMMVQSTGDRDYREPGWMPSSPLTSTLAREPADSLAMRAALRPHSHLGLEGDAENKPDTGKAKRGGGNKAKDGATGEKKAQGFRSSFFGLFGKISSGEKPAGDAGSKGSQPSELARIVGGKSGSATIGRRKGSLGNQLIGEPYLVNDPMIRHSTVSLVDIQVLPPPPNQASSVGHRKARSGDANNLDAADPILLSPISLASRYGDKQPSSQSGAGRDTSITEHDVATEKAARARQATAKPKPVMFAKIPLENEGLRSAAKKGSMFFRRGTAGDMRTEEKDKERGKDREKDTTPKARPMIGRSGSEPLLASVLTTASISPPLPYVRPIPHRHRPSGIEERLGDDARARTAAQKLRETMQGWDGPEDKPPPARTKSLDNLRLVAAESDAVTYANRSSRLRMKRSAPSLTSHLYIRPVARRTGVAVGGQEQRHAEYLRYGAQGRRSSSVGDLLARSDTPRTDRYSATASEFSDRSISSSDKAHDAIQAWTESAGDSHEGDFVAPKSPADTHQGSVNASPITPTPSSGFAGNPIVAQAIASRFSPKASPRHPRPGATSQHLSINTDRLGDLTEPDRTSPASGGSSKATPIARQPSSRQRSMRSLHISVTTDRSRRDSLALPSPGSAMMTPLSPPPVGPLPMLPALPSPFSASLSFRKNSVVSDTASISSAISISLADPKRIKDRRVGGLPLSPSKTFAWGVQGKNGVDLDLSPLEAKPRPNIGRKGSHAPSNAPSTVEATQGNRMTTKTWSDEEAKTLSMMLDELQSYDTTARTSPSYAAMEAIFPLGLEAEKQRLIPRDPAVLASLEQKVARLSLRVAEQTKAQAQDDSPPIPPKRMYTLDRSAGSLSALGIALFPPPSSVSSRSSPGSAPSYKTSFSQEDLTAPSDARDGVRNTRENSEHRTLRKNHLGSVQGLRDMSRLDQRAQSNLPGSRSQPATLTSRASPLRGYEQRPLPGGSLGPGGETETSKRLHRLEVQLEAEKEERAKASGEALTLRMENRKARRKIRELRREKEAFQAQVEQRPVESPAFSEFGSPTSQWCESPENQKTRRSARPHSSPPLESEIRFDSPSKRWEAEANASGAGLVVKARRSSVASPRRDRR